VVHEANPPSEPVEDLTGATDAVFVRGAAEEEGKVATLATGAGGARIRREREGLRETLRCDTDGLRLGEREAEAARLPLPLGLAVNVPVEVRLDERLGE